jgi:hypothetical protein
LDAVVSWTHAPLQSVYPVLQRNEHELLAHAGCALGTVVVHAVPQPLQLFGSVVRSTQLSLQFVGVVDGHPDTQV